jgi:hypothetical protein
MPRISDLTADLKQFAITYPDFSAQLNHLWGELEVDQFSWNPGRMPKDTTYTGNGPAIREFVTWFRNVVKNQKGTPKTDDRARAFDVLERDILGNLNRGAFPEIDPVKFAFQLALRIREPKLIHQTKTNLCGPNSLVIQLARDRPSQYARLATQLFLTGRGFIDTLEIEPDRSIRLGFNASALGECDYVVLGSVRNSPALLLGNNFIRDIGLLTKPGVLCGWLRRAGYEEVEDHVFFDVPFYVRPIDWMTSGKLHGPRPGGFTVPSDLQKKVANLRRMADKLAGGHKVIMNAESALSEGLRQQNLENSGLGTGRSNAMKTHWTFVTKLALSNTHVTEIKLYTWGGAIKRHNIPIEDFASRYTGFVSYKV